MSAGTSLYALTTWHEYFIAAAGATAALSGLIFVAVSINLRTILDEEQKLGSSHLTGRALESLVALLVVLGISLLGLDPSLGHEAFAIVLLAAAAVSALSPARAYLAYRSTRIKPIGFGIRLALAVLLVSSYLVASVTLISQAGGGLHWLVSSFLVAIAIAASNAWVLLVEVLR
jgi:hypothetical protein